MFSKDKIENEVDKACCNANEAGRKVRKIIDKTVADTKEAAAVVEDQVCRNPITASMIAGGVGFLIGALLNSRKT